MDGARAQEEGLERTRDEQKVPDAAAVLFEGDPASQGLKETLHVQVRVMRRILVFLFVITLSKCTLCGRHTATRGIAHSKACSASLIAPIGRVMLEHMIDGHSGEYRGRVTPTIFCHFGRISNGMSTPVMTEWTEEEATLGNV